MFTLKLRTFLIFVMLALFSNAAFGQAPKLGKPITAADLSEWDINILPDGTGLPPGGGTPVDGARVYAAKCAVCHGPEGKGGANARLVGGEPIKNFESEKTIANFWPYSTTPFDYIRRAMPSRQPRCLPTPER